MKEKRKLDKTNKIGIAIICMLVTLALASIILNIVLFGFSFSSIINAGVTCIITAILCIIFGGATSGKYEKKKKKEYGYDYVWEPITLNQFFGGLGLILMCGIGYIPLFIFGGMNIQKMNSPAYIKTEAIIMSVVDTTEEITNPTSSLKYVYKDQNGNEIISKSNGSWGGISFREGEKVTVYYNAANPEIMLNVSDSVMMIAGGLFFLLGGLLACCGCMERHHFVPFLFGLMLMVLPGGLLAGAKLASGMSIFMLLASGPLAYGMILFFAFGIFACVYGVIDAYKYISYNIRERKFNREVKDLLREEKKKNKELEKESKLETKTQKLGKDYNKINARLDKNEISEADKIAEVSAVKKKKKYRYRFTWHQIKSLFGILIAGLVFFGVGLFAFIYAGIMPLAKTASYVKTKATVIELHTYTGKEGNLLAYFDYEYYVNGERYQQESSYGQSAEIAPSVGETITIYYNPKDPNELTDDNWSNWLMVFVSLIFVGTGAALFLVPLLLSAREEVTDEPENREVRRRKEKEETKKNITRIGGKEI